MKKTLLNILFGLLFAALLTGALCIGAVRGWQGEREKALTALFSNEELSAKLEERAMDAANLIVVASRHLDTENEDLTRLKELRATLASQTEDVSAVMQADAELTVLAAALGQALPQIASVQASARDQAYISTLTRTLSEPSSMGESYAELVQGFNERLTKSLTGRLAMLLGVSPLDMR